MFWMADEISRGPTDDFWYEPLYRASASGIRVGPDSAMRLPAVYGCVRVITDAVMQIPLILYRRMGPDLRDKERATDHPLYSLLHDQPNDRFTSAEWREVLQHHLLLRGNAYARKITRAGELMEFDEPHHPDFVEPQLMRMADGRLRLRYMFKPFRTGDVGELLDDVEVLHLRGLTLNGVTGLSPIEIEREAVGVGLSAQEFIGRYFANDARPGGIIEHPGHFAKTSDKDRFREDFQTLQGGANRHKTAILEYGMKYTPLELRLVDQQFLELRKYQNLDIARIFRVPPHMIMEMDRATFSNIEHQSTEFVKNALVPWLKRWEQRLNSTVLEESERGEYFFEFLVDGLQRGDTKTRTMYYKQAVNDGWMTRNEVRQKENMNSGGEELDEFLEPMNMRPAGSAQEPDETPPDEDEDREDRAAQLERNAARALARKQAIELGRAAKTGTNLRERAERILSAGAVAEFMVLPLDEARQVSELSLGDLGATGLSLEDWEQRQYHRLIEASRSL